MKFKVGDKVRVIGNEFNSVNQIGDEGIITQVDEITKRNGLQYRVQVESRSKFANWHTKEELEIIK